MEYNYREAMVADILDAIHEEYTTEEITEKMQDKDSWFDELNDDLWIDDSVTGNASGSYTCNSSEAKEYVIANMEDCIEALREFCVESEEIAKHFLNEDWEWFDVTIRCYLLGQAICEAMDKLEEEAA